MSSGAITVTANRIISRRSYDGAASSGDAAFSDGKDCHWFRDALTGGIIFTAERIAGEFRFHSPRRAAAVADHVGRQGRGET